jgi:predicted  nucleic acid-binding Zn-ribbon protein
MKPLILFIAFLLVSGQQTAFAGDSERIRQLEDEIRTLEQASSTHGEKIQSLESRVGSQASALSKSKSSSPEAVSMTDDGQQPANRRPAKEGVSQKDTD